MSFNVFSIYYSKINTHYTIFLNLFLWCYGMSCDVQFCG